MRIYELRYSGDGEVNSDYYATKSEAQQMARQGGEPQMFAHDFEPTPEDVARLLNHLVSQ